MVSDWANKLTAGLVCSGSYDPSAKSSIAILFKGTFHNCKNIFLNNMFQK